MTQILPLFEIHNPLNPRTSSAFGAPSRCITSFQSSQRQDCTRIGISIAEPSSMITLDQMLGNYSLILDHHSSNTDNHRFEGSIIHLLWPPRTSPQSLQDGLIFPASYNRNLTRCLFNRLSINAPVIAARQCNYNHEGAAKSLVAQFTQFTRPERRSQHTPVDEFPDKQ